MRLGFGVLRLSPRQFWGMTARELAAAALAVYGAPMEALGPAGLAALMRAFPDVSDAE